MPRKVFIDISGSGFDSARLVGEQLISFTLFESMNSLTRFALRLETGRGTQFDAFIKNDENPFTLRLGTDYSLESPSVSTGKSLRLLWASRRLAGQSKLIFTFKGCCNGVVLNMHRAKEKHYHQQRISDIAQDLIEETGLKAQVGTSDGKFDIIGCNFPTGKFISRSLLPYAYSSEGRDWRYWVEDGKVVHFEPTFPTAAPLKFTNLFRDGWIKLRSPQIIKDVRNTAKQRSGKIEVVMYDPEQDRLVSKEIGENAGSFNYHGTGRPVERKFVSETVIVNRMRNRQTDLRPDQLVQQVGKSIWGRHGRGLYTLLGECEYEPGIAINKPAIVDLAGPFGFPDVNSGMWLVRAVKTIYNSGNVRSQVVLEKRWEK